MKIVPLYYSLDIFNKISLLERALYGEVIISCRFGQHNRLVLTQHVIFTCLRDQQRKYPYT